MPSDRDPSGAGPAGPGAPRHRSFPARLARRLVRTVAALVGLVVALVVGAILVLQTDWGRDRVRLFALERLRAMVQGRVDVARLGGDFLHGVALEGVSITGPAGEPFLRVGRLEVNYDLGGVLRKELLFGDIVLEEPRIHVVQDSSGQWNYEKILPFLAGKDEEQPKPPGGWGSVVQVEDLRILRGQITVASEQPGHSFGPLGPSAQVADLNATLAVEIHRRDEEDRKRFEAEDVSFVLDDPRLAVRELDARATLTAGEVELERLLLRTVSTELTGGGHVRDLTTRPVVDFTLKADPLTLAEVRGFAPAIPLDGSVRGVVRVVGPSESLKVAVEDLALQTARSRVEARATLTFEQLDVRPAGSGEMPVFVVDGELSLAPLDPADARAAFAAYPLEEPLRGRFSARGSRERMEVSGEVAFGTTHGRLAGTVGYSGAEPTYDVRLAVDSLDLEDLLEDPAWKSLVNAELHAAGNGVPPDGDLADRKSVV